jgi:hypothetical protein
MMFRILAILCAALPCLAQAQSSGNNKAYAITSRTNGGFEWTEVKQIDLSNGELVRSIFDDKNSAYNLFDGRTAKQIPVKKQPDSTKENQLHPFAGLSAACAYDAKLNRLYYAPLFMNELRYIDLNSSVTSVYMFRNEKLTAAGNDEAEEFHITRMVIASDGNGYALTNNANHLVKFTTDKNPLITDLGPIGDAAENGEVSVHDANTSWGGDMLADASGNLYLISAHNLVFRINTETRTATYLNKVKGLPEGFTTNGAAVNEKGNVVLSSANFITSYYEVDPSNWQATSINSRAEVYNTSDLANENLLFKTNFTTQDAVATTNKISIYPNPVKNNNFKVSFDNKQAGIYNVQLIDVSGKIVSDRLVNVMNGYQVSDMKMNPSLSKGMYLVKVLNHQSKEVFTSKIIRE